MTNIAGQDHYSHEDWVDFVRDAAGPGRHEAMQRHLAEGCESCRELCETWKAVLGIVKREPAFEPPAGAMRLAKAFFAPTAPQPRFALARATAKLLFDSQLAVATAGLRTLRSGPRKLLYENGDFLVDLQIAWSPDRERTFLVGQVMEVGIEAPHVAGLQVLLFREVTVLARTQTNQFGEFCLELDGAADDLSVAVDGDLNHAAMVITLGDHI